jgi:hypothetical protein
VVGGVNAVVGGGPRVCAPPFASPWIYILGGLVGRVVRTSRRRIAGGMGFVMSAQARGTHALPHNTVQYNAVQCSGWGGSGIVKCYSTVVALVV